MCTSLLVDAQLADPTSTSASDDLENPEKIRLLLKDLREARQAKCRDGLKELGHIELSVRLLQSF